MGEIFFVIKIPILNKKLKNRVIVMFIILSQCIKHITDGRYRKKNYKQ